MRRDAFRVAGAGLCAIAFAAEIAGRVSRSAFAMTYAYPLVGDDVLLDIVVTAFRD